MKERKQINNWNQYRKWVEVHGIFWHPQSQQMTKMCHQGCGRADSAHCLRWAIAHNWLSVDPAMTRWLEYTKGGNPEMRP